MDSAPSSPDLVYFDAHNHLQDEWLQPHHGELLQLLPKLGVRGAVVNGSSESDWPSVRALGETAPWLIPSFGLHPWDVGNRSPDWEKTLRALLEETPRAAMGEIGLDQWILKRAKPDDARLLGLRRAPLEEQIEALRRQISLAVEYARPMSIHCLDAHAPLLEVLKSVSLPSRGFLLHAFSGSRELMEAFSRLGAYFSFNGSFLGEGKTRLQEVFRHVPSDHLLVETDAPAMPLPEARRSYQLPSPAAAPGTQVNHPGNIVSVYAGLAELRQVPLADLCADCAANFERLFARAP